MIETNAIIGGEGNGGVMLPDLHIGRDAPLAAALGLQLFSNFNGSFSQLKQTLPQWFIVKKKASIVGINPDQIIASIIAEYTQQGATINTMDGVRIDAPAWWVHIRKSNTEPIVRVIAEAHTEKEANEIAQNFLSGVDGSAPPEWQD